MYNDRRAWVGSLFVLLTTAFMGVPSSVAAEPGIFVASPVRFDCLKSIPVRAAVNVEFGVRSMQCADLEAARLRTYLVLEDWLRNDSHIRRDIEQLKRELQQLDTTSWGLLHASQIELGYITAALAFVGCKTSTPVCIGGVLAFVTASVALALDSEDVGTKLAAITELRNRLANSENALHRNRTAEVSAAITTFNEICRIVQERCTTPRIEPNAPTDVTIE